MSPHAILMSEESSQLDSPPDNDIFPDDQHGDLPEVTTSRTSLLRRFSDEDVHDLVCVGFGPASLAIAVALHDSLELGGEGLSTQNPKVRFLEQQHEFRWHPGMLLPGATMQITFIKDLATLRNPQSQFTFLNYLHKKGRLVAFTNLGTFLPQRIEYEDYLRWCAEPFGNVVDYGQTVESVKAGKTNATTGAIEYFKVTSVHKISGRTRTLNAKNVVVAAGGKPNIPKCLPQNHPRVLHSSQYATKIHGIFPEGSSPRAIAVIGGGQSAVEVWHNIPYRYPGTQSLLMIKGNALKPSDDSPFVNELFNPERVNDVFAQDPEIRAAALALDKATNYGVVRIELLEQIYNEMYAYQLQHRSEEEWPHRILNYREVKGLRDVEVDGRPAVELLIQNNSDLYFAKSLSKAEVMTVDLVVVASGYLRNTHEGILQGLTHISLATDNEGKTWSVRRDYAVKFAPGAVQSDAGIWLQGCNEETHGLSDTLLSILAVRGGEMVENIFGRS